MLDGACCRSLNQTPQVSPAIEAGHRPREPLKRSRAYPRGREGNCSLPSAALATANSSAWAYLKENLEH